RRRPDDVSRSDGSRHGAAGRGARRLVAAAAEKGADAAAGRPRAEMDVRRDRGSFQPLVAQLVVDGLGIVVDLRREPARPGCGERRRRLLEAAQRSEEHTSELQSPDHLVCRLLLEKKKSTYTPDNEY